MTTIFSCKKWKLLNASEKTSSSQIRSRKTHARPIRYLQKRSQNACEVIHLSGLRSDHKINSIRSTIKVLLPPKQNTLAQQFRTLDCFRLIDSQIVQYVKFCLKPYAQSANSVMDTTDFLNKPKMFQTFPTTLCW